MMNRVHRKIQYLLLIVIGLLVVPAVTDAQNKKLTFKDIMKWEDVSKPKISSNGKWLAYNVWPDRGDGEVRIRGIDSDRVYNIPYGKHPKFTKDNKWLGAYLMQPLAEKIENKKKRGLALLNISSGEIIKKDSVKSYTFSNNGHWLVVQFYQTKEIKKKRKKDPKNKFLGTEMLLRNLKTGKEFHIPFVSKVAFDSTSTYVTYTVQDTSGAGNGLYFRNIEDEPSLQQKVSVKENGVFANLRWDNKNRRLAFTTATLDTLFNTDDAVIKMWNPSSGQVKTLVDPSKVDKDWSLRTRNSLKWTDDGKRLFFGFMPQSMVKYNQYSKDEEPDSIDIYDFDQILDKKSGDIWHHQDSRIKPREKKSWNSRKKQLYRAVYHMDTEKWVRLADKDMPKVYVSQNSNYALGKSYVPYLHNQAWDRYHKDYYIVDLKTGKRKRFAKRLRYAAKLSPSGKYGLFFEDDDWHLYNIEEDIYRNLTKDIDVPFYDEDNDRPRASGNYGIAGWLPQDNGVLIYDKYDIWKFTTGQDDPVNLTKDGRGRTMQYRIEDTKKKRKFFHPNEKLLVRGYYDDKKTYGFYTLTLGKQGTEKRLETSHKYTFVTKADQSDRIVYSRESYDEYPNLWISNGKDFNDTRRVTQLHLDLHDKYNWGTSELIEWKSMDDGQTIRGAVIKPDNYDENKTYPVLTYYYRSYSHRAYEFNNITNDDRPTLPQWVSDGYVVFLPDIRFNIGTPGFSATKSLVPGVQKLIEMGIADSDKLGLHGHSWSGYQTAFIITQTDIFDAAIAGAPVSNMTSAYGGIRWGSGRARQSQYEQSQSRIGGSLWEYPERYMENSPIFYADRINTPLLMMFGDEDTAVPWYQGIEMYLAMRRLNKESVFLQYHDEPHHLKKYANRLDYAIKMKQYFDYHLRGKGEPKWIIEGVPYRGN